MWAHHKSPTLEAFQDLVHLLAHLVCNAARLVLILRSSQSGRAFVRHAAELINVVQILVCRRQVHDSIGKLRHARSPELARRFWTVKANLDELLAGLDHLVRFDECTRHLLLECVTQPRAAHRLRCCRSGIFLLGFKTYKNQID